MVLDSSSIAPPLFGTAIICRSVAANKEFGQINRLLLLLLEAIERYRACTERLTLSMKDTTAGACSDLRNTIARSVVPLTSARGR